MYLRAKNQFTQLCKKLLKKIKFDFAEICKNNSGTHAIQSLIEIVNMRQEEDLIKESVKDHIIDLSIHINGTHVMQKIISSISEENRNHINDTLFQNFNKLIVDANGICVVIFFKSD
jgi:hypothetical protein